MASLEWVRNAFGVGTWAEPTGNGGFSSVLTATLHLSSAQILALDTVPVQIVAGQSGKALMPLGGLLKWNPVTTPYDGEDQKFLVTYPSLGPVALAQTPQIFGIFDDPAIVGVFTDTVTRYAFLYPEAGDSFDTGAPRGAAVFNDEPLVVALQVPATGGDGTADVILYYTVVGLT